MRTAPLHERLTQAEAAEIGRRFVDYMGRCDARRLAEKDLRVWLVSLYDDAREWGGEQVKQRSASLGGSSEIRRAA